MPYAIKCWIEIPLEEMEDVEIHETLGAAQSEYNHCTAMQPENHYEVVMVDEDGVEV